MLASVCNKMGGVGLGLRSWVLARGCDKMGGVECLLGDAIKWGELSAW